MITGLSSRTAVTLLDQAGLSRSNFGGVAGNPE
jgi:hypothetical protein